MDLPSRMRLSSPELRGELGSGILDLHSMDDMELLFEDALSEPFECSPSVPVTEKLYENEPDILWSTNKPRSNRQRLDNDSSPMRAALIEGDALCRDNSIARIKVVVRKRPLNKKEIARKEEDIVSIDCQGCSLAVHEPKLKVDLTAYVEKHDFTFDAVLDKNVSNDEVYRVTVEPIIPLIFQRTKATCFAYGQTGSGKTFTMQPLPLRGCQDILNLMEHPSYRNQGLKLWLSFFEIYGGKLYDLLNDRRKLCMREDGRQQVCIVDLKEFPVSDVQLVNEYIERGNAARRTGSTGANEESSRSHAILQLVIKKHSHGKDNKGIRLVGKFSFIDLAGSERGADTTDNDRQTRIEGAEINKSLLALKECIRALDHEQGHIPFRGSKLTEVLRDSFVGDSCTVMISCISPNTGCCEHTLNTLRYADRVKGLSRNSNPKRDPSPGTAASVTVPFEKESVVSSPPALPLQMAETHLEYRVTDGSKWPTLQPNCQVQCRDPNVQSLFPIHSILSSEKCKTASVSIGKDRVILRETSANSPDKQCDPTAVPSWFDSREQKLASPILEKVYNNEKHDKNMNAILIGGVKASTAHRERGYRDKVVTVAAQSRKTESLDLSALQNGYNRHIAAILEEEDDLIAAHRLEVEDSMELVREEMKLLTEIDQLGSRIDHYVSELSSALSRKAAGIVNLQARLARFQRHLKEQDILPHNVNFR